MAHIAVRTAQPTDKEPVLAFCAHTWDFGDYIDSVWDTWQTDTNGQLFVATSDDTPVGIVHVNMLTEIDAWIEGARVHPDYRRQGIARALYEAAMVEAMHRQASYVRLTVDATNTASIKLTESMHMRQVGAFNLYNAAPIAQRAIQEQTQLATANDIDEIIDYLNTSNIFPLTGGLYYSRFTARPITAELLEQKTQAQQIYLLRRWERIDGLAITEHLEEYGEQRLSVGYIDGTAIEAMSFIAYDLQQRLTPLGLDRVRIYSPDFVLMRDALDGVGYESRGALFYTYERSLLA